MSASPSLEKDDWLGEFGSSEDRMLVRVLARSRPECQLVENNDGPNGLEPPKKPVLWGMEPARRRDTPVGFPLAAAGAGFGAGSIPDTPGGRKGLVEGVGRDDCEIGC